MERRTFLLGSTAFITAALFSNGTPLFAKGETVTLPAPDIHGGKALFACMNARHTDRNLTGNDLTLQQLSTLLWCAYGINRSDGRRVVPTARNTQKLLVFVALGDGVWQYEAKNNTIQKVLEGDKRDHFDGSPCIVLYAAPKDDQFAGMHVGSMYQNVGLYCASEGLANCVKHTRHDALDTQLPLPKGWTVLIAHSIGGNK